MTCTRAGFWGLLALRAGVFAVVMLVLFKLLAPLEHRPLPWWDAPVGAVGTRATAAGVFSCVAGVALVMMAKFGLDGAPGWTALGCFVGAAAAAWACAAARTRQHTLLNRRCGIEAVSGIR